MSVVKQEYRRILVWTCGVKDHSHKTKDEAVKCPDGITVRSINILRDYLGGGTLKDAAIKNGLSSADRSVYDACNALDGFLSYRDENGMFEGDKFNEFLDTATASGVRKNKDEWLEKIRCFFDEGD
jgi:hypothetical protein